MNNQIIEDFITQEKQKALSGNILVKLEDSNRVQYGDRLCSGFFEPELNLDGNISAVLATAIGKPLAQWLPIFVHESSHMDRFLENSPLWITTQEYSQIDDWISGKDFPVHTIDGLVDKIILLEADCEKRSLEKIQKFNLPIDVVGYAQNANSYLLFHHYMKEKRTWYDTAPYEIPEIMDKMSKTMKNIEWYLERPSDEILDMFKLCNPPKRVNKPK